MFYIHKSQSTLQTQRSTTDPQRLQLCWELPAQASAWILGFVVELKSSRDDPMKVQLSRFGLNIMNILWDGRDGDRRYKGKIEFTTQEMFPFKACI